MTHQPKGFALAAALMILALLSVLGAAAIQSRTLEAQISATDRDARLSLYLAQATLSEARYYVERGWGKVSVRGIDQVTVETPLAPGLLWTADLYQGFTLVDRRGGTFPVLSHTDSPLAPVITLSTSGSAPKAGRFVLFREIPTAHWEPPYLVVEEDGWATHSTADCWSGWTLWDSLGAANRVLGSSLCPAATGVGQALRLRLSQSPGPAPYVLSLNPWVRALAAGGVNLLGDAEPGAPGWNRVFTDSTGNEIGRGRVEASQEAPGRYLLVSTSTVGTRQRRVTTRVYRSGRADQRVGDWTVP